MPVIVVIYLLVLPLEELCVDKLHDLEEEGVARDEAHIECQSIIRFLDRDNSRVLDDQIRCLVPLTNIVGPPNVTLLVKQLVIADLLV